MNRVQVKKSVSDYSVLIHQRGWVANHDGNVSLRPGKDRFFITPTAVSKRQCTPETIVECELSGAPVSSGRPPSEVALHVGAYSAREEIRAVIHAHPPFASAYALSRKELTPVMMPEVVVSLGTRIPLLPLFLPKEEKVAGCVGQAFLQTDVALLSGNGVLAVGPDLETAYLRVELLEHYARILSIAQSVGPPVALNSTEEEALTSLRQKAGLVMQPTLAQGPSPIRSVVEEEIKKALGGSN